MQYLIAYLGVGLFLAAAGLLYGHFIRKKAVAAFASVLLWPLIVLAALDTFFRSSPKEGDDISFPEDPLKESDDISSSEDPLKEKLAEILQTSGVYLSEQEKMRLVRVAKHGQSQISVFSDGASFADILSKFWDAHIPPEIYRSYKLAASHLDENYDPDCQLRFSCSRLLPDWYIGFSSEFVKSISNVDRKKQGHILEAISKVAAAPKGVVGDTIKPLTGDLSGLWRCRVGDDRLVYYPDAQARKAVLISFSSRDGAYKELPDVSALTFQRNPYGPKTRSTPYRARQQ